MKPLNKDNLELTSAELKTTGEDIEAELCRNRMKQRNKDNSGLYLAV